MIISYTELPNNVEIQLRNCQLEKISRAKFFGIIIDDHESLNDHFEFVTNKIPKSIGLMYKLSSLLPSQVLLELYYSLVYPHLVYDVTA